MKNKMLLTNWLSNGYEFTKKPCKLSRKVTKRLSKYGVAIFDYDDGNSMLVAEFLKEQLERCGVFVYKVHNYRLIFVDDDKSKCTMTGY